MSIFMHIMIALFMLTSLLLIGIILIQKGRGGGLASAFGGGGGGHTAFGSKTGDVLTWATSIIFGIFLLLALVLNWTANPKPAPASANSGVTIPVEGGASAPVESTPEAPATPATPAAPATPAQ